jgi:hypothetical protein
MMGDKQFVELMDRLGVISKLLAWNTLQGKKTLTQRAVALSSMGLKRKNIAWLLDEDPDMISRTLYQAKKAKGSKKDVAK